MRDQFLLDESIVFLNHGSFGACPRSVLAVYQDWQRQLERNPVEFLGRRSASLLTQSRSVLAEFLNARTDDLVYLTNATSGFNTVARSLNLTAGDEILSTDMEYGACDNAWRFVAEQRGAKLVSVTVALPFDEEQFVEELFRAVTTRTRVISISHITSSTALIFPVTKVCRRARAMGILTLVDGAHVPGHLELDLEAVGADFYVGNCHKWLCAPKGVAFLYVREQSQPLVHATVVSWGYSASITQHADIASITGTTLLERRLQWQGTRDIAAFLTVPAAIEFARARDWRAQGARCHELAWETGLQLAAQTGLAPICVARDCGQMLAIQVPETDGALLQRRLYDQFRIEVPVTRHAERLFVRISVFAYNTRAELAALCGALAQIFAPAPA